MSRIFLTLINIKSHPCFSLYQTLLLVFSVLVQVSLILQSLVLVGEQGSPVPCESVMTLRDLLCFTYSLLLLLAVSALALSLRKRREFRREARAIWTYSLFSLAVWIAWVAVSLVYQEYYKYIKGPCPLTSVNKMPQTDE